MVSKSDSLEKLFYIVAVIVLALGQLIFHIPFAGIAFITVILVILIRYRRRLYIVIKTLPRDLRLTKRFISLIFNIKACEYRNKTVIHLFNEQVEKNPGKVCFYFEDQKWTYSDVDKYSNKIAHIFLQAGYKKGDAIGLLMPNQVEYICTWLGLAKIGVITAFLNTNLRDKSLAHCINVASLNAVIFSDETESSIKEIVEEIKHVTLYQLGGQITNGVNKLQELLDKAPVEAPLVSPPQYRDVAVYIYTSGTTGLPKAALIKHSRLLLIGFSTYKMAALTQDDCFYDALPLYHTAGGAVSITVSLCLGVPTVIRKKFSASNYWTDCIKYNCTVGQYIGEMCRYILAVPPKPTDQQHKVKKMLGNGMRPVIWQQFVDRFQIDYVYDFYGSTEGNANIINIDKKVGAVGFIPLFAPSSLLPVAVIRANQNGDPIRDENGFCIRCQAGEPGMFIGIISKIDASKEFNGYVGDKKETSKKIINNVFKKGQSAFVSGDILVMDEEGYLFFKDRTGDTFRWKGENVSTAEVENVIFNVIGLNESVVYGVEIPNYEGRAGMATIVDPDKTIDLKSLTNGFDKKLPIYARPIFIRIASEVNMTGTFKLKKFDLQKEGFNPEVVHDDLYFRRGSEYVKLDKTVYEEIVAGKIRL